MAGDFPAACLSRISLPLEPISMVEGALTAAAWKSHARRSWSSRTGTWAETASPSAADWTSAAPPRKPLDLSLSPTIQLSTFGTHQFLFDSLHCRLELLDP